MRIFPLVFAAAVVLTGCSRSDNPNVAKADSDMKAAGAATSDAADNVAQATGTAARTAGDRARDAAATAADRAGGALETAGDKVRQGANGVGDHDSRTDRDSSDR
ncbi:MAG TPA: hypothetical protein VII73_14190 [Caulobacteraceae bacterium]